MTPPALPPHLQMASDHTEQSAVTREIQKKLYIRRGHAGHFCGSLSQAATWSGRVFLELAGRQGATWCSSDECMERTEVVAGYGGTHVGNGRKQRPLYVMRHSVLCSVLLLAAKVLTFSEMTICSLGRRYAYSFAVFDGTLYIQYRVCLCHRDRLAV